jgi:TetR/AcrR family transcriptional regulator, transcriptional repressor for nem operon
MGTANLREKQKQTSRAKILKAASTLFGKHGLQATGIDTIMKKAGLTAGAFYAHFESKDQLIEEVLWSALPIHQHVPATEFVSYYLSTEHRDHPESACPLATLGSDLARADRGLKKRIAKRLDAVINERIKNSPSMSKKKALAGLSLAVGAMILARITVESDLSKDFLDCHK